MFATDTWPTIGTGARRSGPGPLPRRARLRRLRELFTADATVTNRGTATGHDALVEQARRRHSATTASSTSSPT